MNLVARFERYVEENKLFSKSEKLLLTVSGGRDSMLLSWLMIKCGYDVHIAHCNFQLRGEESDGDEQLVRDFAAQYALPIYVKTFDTVAYAELHKISIQMAARELRYAWFTELCSAHGLSKILVAQHMNDHVETVLLNLTRGTGLAGLQGILSKRQDSKVVRPLLFLTSKEITALVSQYQIPYRDDSSNFSNKYIRNKIRLDIIPQFEQLNEDFVYIMNDNIERFQESNEMLQDFITDLRNSLFINKNNGQISISKSELAKQSLAKLYMLFEPYNFVKPVLQDMKESLSKESGRMFESSTHQLLLDREELLLKSMSEPDSDLVIDKEAVSFRWNEYAFEMSCTEDIKIVRDLMVGKFDYAKIVFPLRLRSWRDGDMFQPLGMIGKKKLSDLFVQKKINLFDKKRIPVLVNGDGEIIWVVGLQMDDRFKIVDNTQKVLNLVVRK